MSSEQPGSCYSAKYSGSKPAGHKSKDPLANFRNGIEFVTQNLEEYINEWSNAAVFHGALI